MTDAVLGTLVWVLPRPRPPYYPGSFPLWFEQRLWRLLGKPDPKEVLHPFGGMAEIGVRVDINPDVHPDVVGDAHDLPFDDASFKAVICDPAYSNEENATLYNVTTPLRQKAWIKEAVRVCKKNGFVVIYHDKWIPKPPECSYWLRIIVLPGQNHRGRICHIFMKDGGRKYGLD